jgi:hypothetical protein
MPTPTRQDAACTFGPPYQRSPYKRLPAASKRARGFRAEDPSKQTDVAGSIEHRRGKMPRVLSVPYKRLPYKRLPAASKRTRGFRAEDPSKQTDIAGSMPTPTRQDAACTFGPPVQAVPPYKRLPAASKRTRGFRAKDSSKQTDLAGSIELRRGKMPRVLSVLVQAVPVQAASSRFEANKRIPGERRGSLSERLVQAD